MRKLLLAGLFISITFFASAQITKGSVLLGGGVSYNHAKSDASTNNETKQSTVSINLAAGTAVKQNTIVGGSLSYSTSTYKTETTNPSKGSSYGGGVFVRQYQPLGKNFYLFAQGDLGYNYGTNKYIPSTAEVRNEKSWSTGLSVTPGISYALTKTFHLELGFNNLVGISYGKNKTTTTSTSGSSVSDRSYFNVNTNIGASAPLNIGFRILLAK